MASNHHWWHNFNIMVLNPHWYQIFNMTWNPRWYHSLNIIRASNKHRNHTVAALWHSTNIDTRVVWSGLLQCQPSSNGTNERPNLKGSWLQYKMIAEAACLGIYVFRFWSPCRNSNFIDVKAPWRPDFNFVILQDHRPPGPVYDNTSMNIKA